PLDFTTKSLKVTYVSATDVFTVAGGASFMLTTSANKTIKADVLFGDQTLKTQGLVITAGALTSLDMAVDGKVSVGPLDFATKSLKVTYAAATDVFTVAGGASFM